MKKLKNSILFHSGITLSFLLLFPVLQLHTSNKKKLHFEIIKRKIDPIIIEKNDSINFKPPVDLNEVVVTGQGNSITRRRLSSRVTSINADDFAGLSNNRLDEMLQTSIPNVQINMTNGQPGSTSQIKSRGLSSAFSNSTPIVYVDGVRVDNMNTGATLGFSRNGYSAEPYSTADLPMGQTAASGAISDIPLENIDHIEYVSGGAATTLYGSDAANGVIQIFTKKGGNGRFNGSFSTQIGLAAATSQFYHFRRTKDLLNQTGYIQQYRLNFVGGNERFGYSLGAGMSSNTGIVIHDGNMNKKYDFRFGSHLKVNNLLEYENSFGLTFSDFRRSRNGNQGLYTGLWTTECSAAADLRYIDDNGITHNFNPDIDAMGNAEYLQLKNFIDKAESLQNDRENVKRFQTSHTLFFTPLASLSFKGTFGLDYRASTNKEIITNEYLIHTQVKPEGTSDAGRVFNADRNYFGITVDLNGQYKLYHDDWFSNILTAGFQYFNTHDHQTAYNGTNVADGMKVMSGAGIIYADEWLSYLNNYGFYAQNNVGFLNRYYLDLGMRVDYNTAFGDNVGWQFYPKVGLSYILSEEKFIQHWVQSGVLGTFRLLANYGVAGSFPPAFAYQKTINITSFQGYQAANFGNYGNSNLGPEKKHSFEIGFDATFFHNLLNLGFTYYYVRTKDAIFSIPTLPSSGQASTYLANVGDIKNSGIELTLGITPVHTRDWLLDLRASLNTNDNIVLSTGGQVPFSIGGFSTNTIQNTVKEGKPVGYLLGNEAVLNADGTLKEMRELADLGSTIPKLYGNLLLTAVYRDLRLNVSGDYQAGSYVHSFDRQFRFRKGLIDSEIPASALQGLDQGTAWLYFTNYFVDKADFLKIRNISLDYTWKLLHLPVKSVNISLNVRNPFCMTTATVDPEATLSGALSQGAVATSGINYATYSSPEEYLLTVKLDF